MKNQDKEILHRLVREHEDVLGSSRATLLALRALMAAMEELKCPPGELRNQCGAHRQRQCHRYYHLGPPSARLTSPAYANFTAFQFICSPTPSSLPTACRWISVSMGKPSVSQSEDADAYDLLILFPRYNGPENGEFSGDRGRYFLLRFDLDIDRQPPLLLFI